MGVKRMKSLRRGTERLVTGKLKLKMISKEFKCQLDDSVKLNERSNMSVHLKQGETVENCMNSNSSVTVNMLEGSNDHNPDEMPAQCEFCGKQYKNDKRLKDHLRFCHPKVYHKCTICSREFPKKWILNTHIRKHTNEFPYSCSDCGQKFISNSKLQKHSNYHHKQEELFCTICNAIGFYTRQDLGNHIRTKHTKERAFLCDVCDKSFMSSSVYYQHQFIHKNIKKYSCKICCKGFRRGSTLHKHLRIHKNEFPFSCDVCRQVFRQKGDVKKHKTNQHSNLKV